MLHFAWYSRIHYYKPQISTLDIDILHVTVLPPERYRYIPTGQLLAPLPLYVQYVKFVFFTYKLSNVSYTLTLRVLPSGSLKLANYCCLTVYL